MTQDTDRKSQSPRKSPRTSNYFHCVGRGFAISYSEVPRIRDLCAKQRKVISNRSAQSKDALVDHFQNSEGTSKQASLLQRSVMVNEKFFASDILGLRLVRSQNGAWLSRLTSLRGKQRTEESSRYLRFICPVVVLSPCCGTRCIIVVSDKTVSDHGFKHTVTRGAFPCQMRKQSRSNLAMAAHRGNRSLKASIFRGSL